MRITSFLAFSTVGLALVACRGSNNSNNVDSPPGGDGSAGGTVKIQDVQSIQMMPGTPVKLAGVIVTAIDTFGGKTGDIWVEEPEGGQWSGVHVYKADPTAVASLAVGDIVNISGAIKSEFALSGSNADPTGRTETELEPAASGQTITVTKTGTGTVPPPADVDALMIGQMPDADMQGSAFSAAWEPWEGVLIKTSNVSALSAPKSFGSSTPVPLDNYDFGMTGVIKVEGSLTDITMSGIQRNTCFGSVTGVLGYFYDYLLYPTQASDMVTGGTGCPVAEAICGDSIDNDGNGFADCADDNCVGTATTCRSVTTVLSIDQAVDASPGSPTLPTTGVEIDGVYVTAIDPKGNFWISSSASAATDSGLYVYSGGQTLPTGVVVGSKVNVIGRMQAYKANKTTTTEVLPELNVITVTKVNDTGTIQASTQLPASLNATSSGRPWVGSLVTISGKNKITAGQTAANHYTGTLTNGATTYEYLGTIVKDANPLNFCYGSLTGVWTWDGYNNKYALIPTSMPTVESTGCP
jgi:hypothetical protein